MGKSLGVAAFVVLLLSVPIPLMGTYITFLALLILCGAAFHGDKLWTVTVDVIAFVKVFFLSPTWHLMMFGGGYARGIQREFGGYMDPATRSVGEGSARILGGMNAVALLATVAFLAAPIIILVWRSRTPIPVNEGASDA